MHELQTVVTDAYGVCLSVCHECAVWPWLGFTVRWCVQCTWRGHLVQPSPNAFGLLLLCCITRCGKWDLKPYWTNCGRLVWQAGDVYRPWDERHSVFQYHYTAWPDKALPSDSKILVQFLCEVLNKQASLCDAGPVVVHCRSLIARRVSSYFYYLVQPRKIALKMKKLCKAYKQNCTKVAGRFWLIYTNLVLTLSKNKQIERNWCLCSSV